MNCSSPDRILRPAVFRKAASLARQQRFANDREGPDRRRWAACGQRVARPAGGELRKVAGKKKRKVKANSAKDHPGVRAALQSAHGEERADWLDRLNAHGAHAGDTACSPGSERAAGLSGVARPAPN